MAGLSTTYSAVDWGHSKKNFVALPCLVAEKSKTTAQNAGCIEKERTAGEFPAAG